MRVGSAPEVGGGGAAPVAHFPKANRRPVITLCTTYSGSCNPSKPIGFHMRNFITLTSETLSTPGQTSHDVWPPVLHAKQMRNSITFNIQFTDF